MKVLREPLLHFVLAGVALRVVHAWLNRGDDARKYDCCKGGKR